MSGALFDKTADMVRSEIMYILINKQYMIEIYFSLILSFVLKKVIGF